MPSFLCVVGVGEGVGWVRWVGVASGVGSLGGILAVRPPRTRLSTTNPLSIKQTHRLDGTGRGSASRSERARLCVLGLGWVEWGLSPRGSCLLSRAMRFACCPIITIIQQRLAWDGSGEGPGLRHHDRPRLELRLLGSMGGMHLCDGAAEGGSHSGSGLPSGAVSPAQSVGSGAGTPQGSRRFFSADSSQSYGSGTPLRRSPRINSGSHPHRPPPLALGLAPVAEGEEEE